jgi:hypothetical protein
MKEIYMKYLFTSQKLATTMDVIPCGVAYVVATLRATGRDVYAINLQQCRV